MRVRLGKYIADVLTGRADELFWQIVRLGLCVCLVGSIFGAIHCFSWNAFFPTAIERRLWRISAVVVTVSPSVVILLTLFTYVTTGAGSLVMLPSMVIAVVYSVARLYLLVLALLALPHLPYWAYLTPSWTIYLPHIA